MLKIHAKPKSACIMHCETRLYESVAKQVLNGGGFLGRALVASFGFDEKFVVRAIIRHGIGGGDLVVLVTATPTEKTLSAYKYVADIAGKVDARVELYALGEKVYDFTTLAVEAKKLLTKLAREYERVTLLLSGGMRVIVLGLYTAALALPEEVKEKIVVELDTEDRGVRVEIPREVVELFKMPELGAKRQLLELIVREPGQTIEQLAKKLGKDESTVRRQLQTLVEQKLVKLDGRPTKPQPTPAAKILVDRW